MLHPTTNSKRKTIRDRTNYLGQGVAMLNLLNTIDQVAKKNTPILLEGETGTGKSLLARKVHELSHRNGHFVSINCATFGANLLETELFGHTKGAFTGAISAREGLVGRAKNGTLFLDEVGELPLDFQPKLLHLLEEKVIRPVGSDTDQNTSIRIIAATNQHLKTLVKEGKFRADLFYRLNVIPLTVPALRHRLDDITGLTQNFIRQLCDEHQLPTIELSTSSITALKNHLWPGNIRELRNHIEHALLLGIPLKEKLPQLTPNTSSTLSSTLAFIEKEHILSMLNQTSGNKSAAANVLDISRRTLDRKLKQWAELER